MRDFYNYFDTFYWSLSGMEKTYFDIKIFVYIYTQLKMAG